MTLILVRHGEAVSKATGVIGGSSDYPLTDLGRDQARAAAARLAQTPLDAIYASDLSRAAETARLIAEVVGLEVTEHAALRERDWGDAEGLNAEQIAERFGADVPRGQGHIPNEETHDQLRARVTPIFRELHERHLAERAVVVAHAGTIIGVLAHLIDVPPSQLPRFHMANTGFTTVEGTTPPSLGAINDHAHL